jgi:glucosamine--fructose-6-phosphate aminotransferase (isomerizing)
MNESTRALESSVLYQDMRDTIVLIQDLNVEGIAAFLPNIASENIFISGEGSSRIFPAKKVIYDALRNNYRERFVTENATQALEYDLQKYSVFIISNSGKTRECVRLIDALKSRGHGNVFGIAAHDETPVIQRATKGWLLDCGSEQAVASTKSVVAEALFFDVLFRLRNDKPLPDFEKLSNTFEHALVIDIPESILRSVAQADTIYFSGRNNGVAEELVLKANEISRKKSIYLEGTYALHGVEEVIRSDDAVVVIDPFAEEEEKFHEVLVAGVGVPVVAISSHKTAFPTMAIPDAGQFQPYLELAAGWNMLVQVGLRNNVNIDRPKRARKTGNELEA